MKQAFVQGLLSTRVSAAAMGLVLAAGQALALTPAGTDINNRATVTYEDANGNSYSAQSNESSVTVAEVYAATLEDDGTKYGAPGETVYFSHTLTNTGNAQDTFSLAAGSGTTIPVGAPAYSVYYDVNGNGLPDSGEQVVTSLTLNANQIANLVVAVPVPAAATNGSTVESTLHVLSSGGGAGTVKDIGANSDVGSYDADGDSTPDGNDTNHQVVNVTTGPVLQLNKTASVSEAAAGDFITYTLQMTNTGGSPASDVIIADPIPAGTTFDAIVSVNGLLAGNGDEWLDEGSNWQATVGAAYPAAANLDLTLEEPAGEDLNGNGTPAEADLAGIRFRDAEIGVNTTVTIVYRVQVNVAASAGDSIRNTFIAGEDGDGNNSPDDPSKSNTTTTTVTQGYGVDVTDTGDAADDDATVNDVALQDSAAAGAVVTFANVIANSGNGADSFDLAISNDAGAGYGGAGVTPAGPQAFPAGNPVHVLGREQQCSVD